MYVWVVVGTDGSVSDARLPEVEAENRDIGNLYIGTALRLAEACVFQPAILDGAPVSVRKRVRFFFEHFGI